MNAAVTELWPYLLLVLLGYLPNEVWRVLGLVLARGLNEDSEMVMWSRAVATAILAGVIAKLILFSAGALADIPLAVRVAAAVCGFLAFLAVKRSVFVGVAVGEAVLLAGGFLFAAEPLAGGDRRGELLGVFGQHVGLFLFARRRLHRHAALARDDVHMQVEHHLSAGAFVELLHGDAVGGKRRHRGFGDLSARPS